MCTYIYIYTHICVEIHYICIYIYIYRDTHKYIHPSARQKSVSPRRQMPGSMS